MKTNALLADARPDFSTISTDFRMEVSSSAGLSHINNYMHPHAVIVDTSGIEDEFFLRAYRERANDLGISLIELPSNAEQSLMWLTRLDFASLNGKFMLISITFKSLYSFSVRYMFKSAASAENSFI